MMRQLVSALAQKIDPFPFFLVRDVKQPLTVIIASSQTHHVHRVPSSTSAALLNSSPNCLRVLSSPLRKSHAAVCSQYILGAALKDIPQKLQASINISQTKLKQYRNIGRLY